MYFDESIDKATEKTLHTVKVIPGRGAWLEFDVDKRDTVGVRIDRKRRQPVTVLPRRSAGPTSRSASGSGSPRS